MWNQDGGTLMDEMYYLVNRVAAHVNKEMLLRESGFVSLFGPEPGVNSSHAQVGWRF